MAYTSGRTFYDVLELNKSASRNDVKDAYKKMALKRHPDKNPHDKRAVAKFQEVQEAYETLYDNTKRMSYNVKIGLNRSLPLRPALFTDIASSWGTPTPYNPPQAFKRPDWFWSGAPEPKQSGPPPKTTEYEEDGKVWEDWSRPYEEPKQDLYEEWQKEEEQRKKEFDELTAQKEKDWYEEWQEEEKQRQRHLQELMTQKLEKQRKKVKAKTPHALAVTLTTILRLQSAIEKMEAENKAANVVIEEWIGMDETEEGFFDEVCQRNVALNTHRRELESEFGKYRKLYKDLKTFDPKQGAEAEQIYRKLKKQTAKGRRTEEKHSQQGSDDQEQKAKEERRHQREESKMASEGYRRQAEKRKLVHEEYHRQAKERIPMNEEQHRQKAKRRTNGEERMEEGKSSSPERTPTPDTGTSSELATEMDCSPDAQVYEGDKSNHNGAEDGCEPDEEFVFIQSRRIHAQHLEVKNEFWEIAEGLHVCCFCGNMLTVFECPKYGQCGLRACERCRFSPPRNP